MSLVYFNGAGTEEETIALIKEKTWLELIYGSQSSSHYSCQVKFPDMENYVELQMMRLTSGKSALCFVDVENHFFAYVSPQTDMKNYNPAESIITWLAILIHEKDGKLVNEIAPDDGAYMSSYCNIPGHVSNTLKEQITLVPLCMSASLSFIKKAYINYERMFQPGLKFIDQNRNEFITLGGYLLYYNGKHK